MQKRPDGSGVSFVGDDAAEDAVWNSLGDIPAAEPSPELRRRFYRQLDNETATVRSSTVVGRVGRLLGFDAATGWLSATAALLLGLALGLTVPNGGQSRSVDLLERQVADLRRDLILDRLESATPSKRLRGVIDAVNLAERDPIVANALLETATADRVQAVRTAAIDALGPQVRADAVGDALMRELETSDSPLVQLALVDLVLRHGSRAQVRTLLSLAQAGELHPELVEHVLSSVSEERA